MSTRSEPFWYCHQCHAEMRPLMTPNPICASCRGSFVEKLENPEDDPRDFQNRAPPILDHLGDSPDPFEALSRSSAWRTPDPTSTSSRNRSSPTHRTHDHTPASTGFHFEFRRGPGGANTRTFVLGQNTDDPPPATFFEFLRGAHDNTPNTRANGGIAGSLMEQYILGLFSGANIAQNHQFAELLGMPTSAQFGDYVFNQEALDRILNNLAENSTAGRPVPATEEVVDNLSREVLTEDSPLLEKDCAVCKESFKLDVEDPDDLIVVTLPCKHPFHAGCILPWLKSSGTCPVCRFALVPQPQQHSPGPSGAGSNSDNTDSSTGSRPRPPENSDRGSGSGGSGGSGGGLLHAIFGGGAGASGGRNNAYPSRSRRNRNVHPEFVSQSTPYFPGQWIEDID